MVVHPPDPTCLPSFNSEAFKLMEVHFWSPTEFWRKLGVDELPCPRHGYQHTQYVHQYEYRQRLVKGVSEDFTLAGRNYKCTECKREHDAIATLLKAAKVMYAPKSEQHSVVTIIRKKPNEALGSRFERK
jgi:hypothetical protein